MVGFTSLARSAIIEGEDDAGADFESWVIDVCTERFDYAGTLVTKDAGEGDGGIEASLYEEVRMTDPSVVDFDEDFVGLEWGEGCGG